MINFLQDDIDKLDDKNQLGARRLARRMAMQALYQWSFSGGEISAIERQHKQYNLSEKTQSGQVDLDYFSILLKGVIEHVDSLDQAIAGVSERKIEALNKVELALLRIGAFELARRLDVPAQVAINEAIEIAKEFGGAGSFRYVNAVMDRLLAQFRPQSLSETDSESPS